MVTIQSISKVYVVIIKCERTLRIPKIEMQREKYTLQYHNFGLMPKMNMTGKNMIIA